MAARATGRIAKLKALWREGMENIPEVMLASCLGAVSTIGIITILTIKGPDGFRSKYLVEPTVFRPDDPAVEKIQKYSPLDRFA